MQDPPLSVLYLRRLNPLMNLQLMKLAQVIKEQGTWDVWQLGGRRPSASSGSSETPTPAFMTVRVRHESIRCGPESLLPELLHVATFHVLIANVATFDWQQRRGKDVGRGVKLFGTIANDMKMAPPPPPPGQHYGPVNQDTKPIDFQLQFFLPPL